MLDVLDFAGACRGADAVVTGEGRLDASSLEGKLPMVVARRARALGLRVSAASVVAATAGSAPPRSSTT